MDLKDLEGRLRERTGGGGCWTLGRSPLAGRGLLATRDLKPGDLIFIDTPLLIGPRTRGDAVCVMCLRGGLNLECCQCGLPLCGGGECGAGHEGECGRLRAMGAGCPRPASPCSDPLAAALTPLRVLYTLDNDELQILANMQPSAESGNDREVILAKKELRLSPKEEALMLRTCRMLDSVAFEVVIDSGSSAGTGRAIYPLAAMLNHSCCPNTRHSFTHLPREGRPPTYGVILIASKEVRTGEELTTNYCPLLWGTPARSQHLSLTKGFICTCPRCSDPTEFGTYFSSLECPKCGGRVVADDPVAVGGGRWSCRGPCCGLHLTTKEAATRLIRAALLGPNSPPNAFLCQLSIQQAMHSVWKMDKNPGLSQEISNEELLNHENMIRSVLNLIEKLRLGMCTKRGQLLFQLYLSLKEKERRMLLNDSEEPLACSHRFAVLCIEATSQPARRRRSHHQDNDELGEKEYTQLLASIFGDQ